MKTKEKNSDTTISKIRDIREKVSREIQDMNAEELKAYLKKKAPLHPKLRKEQE
ncbi:MAG: hypothetical protein WD357_10185 [Gracilimonas sp.]